VRGASGINFPFLYIERPGDGNAFEGVYAVIIGHSGYVIAHTPFKALLLGYPLIESGHFVRVLCVIPEKELDHVAYALPFQLACGTKIHVLEHEVPKSYKGLLDRRAEPYGVYPLFYE
jgi:hypothetical protein